MAPSGAGSRGEVLSRGGKDSGTSATSGVSGVQAALAAVGHSLPCPLNCNQFKSSAVDNI